jgi:uncharacterized protein (DUF4415 family)
MKGRHIMSISKKRLAEIKKIKDEKIDYSDIPETDEKFWAKAEMKMPETKKGVYLRVDPEVLTWFQKAGKGYQTRINAVLRSYVDAQKGRPAR